MQMEVCCLSFCKWRNKRKLSVCKRTKQTKQDLPICMYIHRWACLMKQQLSITVYWLSTKKQTSVFHFCLQETNGSLPFLFSICSRQQNLPFSVSFDICLSTVCMCMCGYLCVGVGGWVCVCVCCVFMCVCENGRQKRRFSLIHLPFAHCANGSLSFVRLLTKKQWKLSVCKGTKWLNGLAHLCLYHTMFDLFWEPARNATWLEKKYKVTFNTAYLLKAQDSLVHLIFHWTLPLRTRTERKLKTKSWSYGKRKIIRQEHSATANRISEIWHIIIHKLQMLIISVVSRFCQRHFKI